MSKVYIGIDCAPGGPRPNKYIGEACKLIGIEPNECTDKCFGAWSWYIPSDNKEAYLAAKPALKEYFDKLYAQGSIRGAEWGWRDE